MANPTYQFKQYVSDHLLEYIFVSKGRIETVKIVQFSYTTELYGKRVFNLGFGDYNPEQRKIDDSVNTDNGDVYKVFNTVLNTIPEFFKIFPNAIVMVGGSDSRQNYAINCRLTCRKNCTTYCKNQHRRISIYTHFVNKHFTTLSIDLTFYGGKVDANDNIKIESYSPGKNYDFVFIAKKTLNLNQ